MTDTAEEFLRGPDVAVIGWIPQIDTLPIGYADLPARQQFAMRSMFRFSGNPVPHVANLDDLIRLEDSKEFRLILAMWSVEARWINDRPDVRFLRRAVVGYTPIPLPGLRYYSRGASALGVDSTEAVDSVTVAMTFSVRISPLADYLQAAVTGLGAPLASVRLKYTIFRDKRYAVAAESSCIPTQSYLVGWQETGTHDMLENGHDDVMAFVAAGGGSWAPMKTCLQVSGSLV